MRIPEIRDELIEIAGDLCYNHGLEDIGLRILELVEETKRRRSATGPRKSVYRKVTPKVAAEVRQYAKDNPEATQEMIGIAMNLNSGRVSEILNGHRE